MTIHLIAQFAALAHARGWRIHSGHGPGGWVLWVQPRGLSQAIGHLKGTPGIQSWYGRRA